jgi:serine/threonine protein kinase
MFDSVVCLFGAFKNATRDLRNYYIALGDDLTSPLPHANPGFPYSTTFTHLETGISTLFKLEFQPLPDKLLYTGMTDTGVDIIVKFVRSYSRALHAHCSSLGSAPPLLGHETLDGGWFMVVMNDMVDYRPFSALEKSSLSSQLRPMVLDLVDSFHQQNLVHGDLRDTNILVREDGGRLEIKLVDFDWGGVEGEVRYPSAINCTDFWRPPEVSDSMLITKVHDIQMVKYMFEGLP